MKRIIKNSQPDFLREWFKKEKRENLDVTYEGGFKSAFVEELGERETLYKKVKESLLDEQGYLCCYTGKRIDLETSHIEHLKPQTESKKNRVAGNQDYDDVNYRNLLAAFPKVNECEFGARPRGDKKLPITPLEANCEKRFLFTQFGEIQGVNDDAKDTIAILNLDCEVLRDERSIVINSILTNEDLTEAAVERAAENMFEKDGKGRFKPYCFVLKLACELRLKKIERDRIRNRFARR